MCTIKSPFDWRTFFGFQARCITMVKTKVNLFKAYETN